MFWARSAHFLHYLFFELLERLKYKFILISYWRPYTILPADYIFMLDSFFMVFWFFDDGLVSFVFFGYGEVGGVSVERWG